MIHLHWHSHYSLLDAVGTPDKIVEKASEYNMSAIAITDYAWMYGAVEFYETATKAWIKPIIWIEIPVVYEMNNQDAWIVQNIVLIAKDNDWYQNLMELTSYSHLQNPKSFPKIDIAKLKQHSKWLIWIMWWANSKIWNMIINKEDDNKIKETIQMYKEIFEWNFYLEVICQNESKLENIKDINQKVIELASQLEITLIVGNEYTYINQEDKEAYEVLLCIKDNAKYLKSFVKWDYHIFQENEVYDTMEKNWYSKEFIKTLIDNNQKVADLVTLELPIWKIFFPKYESPQNIKEIYEKYKDQLIEND